MEELEVPDVPDFIDLLHAAGAHMYACKLTFDMMKMIEADLHPGVEGVIILDGRVPHSVLLELLTPHGVGTRISRTGV